MKWILLLCVGLCFISCNAYEQATDPLDAAREFIDACLKGDFDKAAFYMLPGEENNAQLEQLKAQYRARSAKEKEAYRDASLNILEESVVNDSIHIINYKNSYDNVARKARVVERSGNWLVDLTYTFNGNL